MTSSIRVTLSQTLATPLAVEYMTAQKLGATEIKLTQAFPTKWNKNIYCQYWEIKVKSASL